MRSKALLSVVLFASLLIVARAEAANGIRFEITGSGTLTHFEGGPVAGLKPPVTKVSAAQIALCIQGTGVNCNNLANNGTGKAFLYIPDGVNGEIVYISTDPNCGGLTELDGIVGGTGTFMYAGKHSFAGNDTNIFIQGTVTFDKTQFPALVPLGIKKGSVMAVSEDIQHYGVGTFTTVAGTATAVSCLP
jgi:hypothetical protein